jgi:hypothetical protein
MLLEQVGADAEVVRGQDVQSAMIEVHAATDATIEVHAATDATIEVHAATDATIKAHAATDATIEAHAPTDATIEAHAPTDATIVGHAATDATIGGHARTDATIEAHARTDATIEAHAPTDATTEAHAATEVHAVTDATTEAHAATDAKIGAHAPTDATIGGHAATDATTEGHAQTIVMEVILDHSVMTDHRASVIVTVMSASPLPMNHQRCVNLEEGPQHAEVVRVEDRVDAGRVREVRADVVWAAVARMGSHHHLLLLAAETPMNGVQRHMYQTATCSKRISMKTNPKRERCEAGGINHPQTVKRRNRIHCHNQYC